MAETAAYELLMIFTEENNLLPVGMEPNWSVEKSIKCMKITVSQTSYPLSIDCCVKQRFRNIFCFLLYSLVSFDPDTPLVETPYQRLDAHLCEAKPKTWVVSRKVFAWQHFTCCCHCWAKGTWSLLVKHCSTCWHEPRRVWTSMPPLWVGQGEQPGSSVL